jgi:uridine monophosphate synthetase
MEAVGKLSSAGLKVDTVVAFLDREQGARQNLESKGLNLITVITASQLLQILEASGKITAQQAADARSFFRDNKPTAELPSAPKPAVSHRSFAERKSFASCAMVKDLFGIMEQKQTNLCVACDVRSTKEVLHLADALGPFIAVLKTHVDIISDFEYDSFVKPLLELSRRHNFLIFEDRKFADIGNTVKAQYEGGVYRIAEWAHLSNSHLVSGASSIGSIREAAQSSTSNSRGLLLIAQMSTQDTLASGNHLAQLSLDVASKYPDFVAGFICQGRLRQFVQESDEGLLYCTPGVQIESQGDAQGQKYKTPEQVVADGADLIIVGRGITAAADPRTAASEYRSRGWAAYLSRCQKP